MVTGSDIVGIDCATGKPPWRTPFPIAAADKNAGGIRAGNNLWVGSLIVSFFGPRAPDQETMELYKQGVVSPVGGCLPTLIQLPILFALYTLFAHAIELRHAPFIWWITDLSAKDPLMITPILMTASMWLQQKMAPQAGDPNQMKMMRFMPLIFGIMFLGFPSGLVLYWLTNNVVTIIQQEVTLHLIGERKRKKPAGKKGGKK